FPTRRSSDLYNPSDYFLSNWYLHDTSCTANFIAFFNFCEWPKNNDTDITFFQVLCHTYDTIRKFDSFPSHDIVESMSTCNTVPNLDYSSNVTNFYLFVEV